jgi:hypothetical protein
MMELIELRELKHIVANFSFRKKASGYRIESQSVISKALYELVKRNVIEPAGTKGFFIYMRPVKNFIMKLSDFEKQQLGIEFQ